MTVLIYLTYLLILTIRIKSWYKILRLKYKSEEKGLKGNESLFNKRQ